MKNLIIGIIFGIVFSLLFLFDIVVNQKPVIVEKKVEVEVIKEIQLPPEIIEKIKYKTIIKKEIVNVCEEEFVETTKDLADFSEKQEMFFEEKRNRLSLLVGYGPNGINREDLSSSQIQVDSKYEVLFGAQYQRKFKDLNIGVGGFSNNMFFGSVGVDF